MIKIHVFKDPNCWFEVDVYKGKVYIDYLDEELEKGLTIHEDHFDLYVDALAEAVSIARDMIKSRKEETCP